MTTPRVQCSAAPIHRDRHQCTGSWWIVTSPDGQRYELCSGACLVSFAVIGALPADIEVRQRAEGEVAA